MLKCIFHLNCIDLGLCIIYKDLYFNYCQSK
jgi:hypothetical protein